MLVITLIIVTSLIVLYLTGPRLSVDQTIRPIELPDDLDEYLAEREANVKNLRPNTEACIVWANPEHKQKTPYAIVYLHGFSANRQETAPVTERIAETIGANVYYPRLAGHGQLGRELGQATTNDWLNDSLEAVKIGQRLGEKVILIGTSTGAPLACWLANRPEATNLHALLFISPNFAIKDPRSGVTFWPWGESIIPILVGKLRHWKPNNLLHAKYWTNDYPPSALLAMMGVVKLMHDLDLAQIKVPMFIAYCPDDQVVSVPAMHHYFPLFGSENKVMIPVEQAEDPENHVIAGQALSPRNSEGLAQTMLGFLYRRNEV
ncbi:alpha/beta hydrolase [Anaerolineales bacterium HSG6]|nr:alpha/beta hydrolase [Anaerolineales bacterium HSG6]MDM8531205.1 alpha/beta hydrolase [Anaerolineales bacterium HSG25]